MESASLQLQASERSTASGRRRAWNVLLPCLYALGMLGLGAMAVVRFSHEARLSTSNPAVAADAQIPAGACVLTDVASYTIVANRFFSAKSTCPRLIDSIGTDYALADGRNALVGAGQNPAVQRVWEAAFRQAQFVWLSCAPVTSPSCANATGRRIPWTPVISTYFTTHFRAERGAAGFLFVRVRR